MLEMYRRGISWLILSVKSLIKHMQGHFTVCNRMYRTVRFVDFDNAPYHRRGGVKTEIFPFMFLY
jgi:hypothetical protein